MKRETTFIINKNIHEKFKQKLKEAGYRTASEFFREKIREFMKEMEEEVKEG